jgi:hypothetical protein
MWDFVLFVRMDDVSLVGLYIRHWPIYQTQALIYPGALSTSGSIEYIWEHCGHPAAQHVLCPSVSITHVHPAALCTSSRGGHSVRFGLGLISDLWIRLKRAESNIMSDIRLNCWYSNLWMSVPDHARVRARACPYPNHVHVHIYVHVHFQVHSAWS